MDKGYIKLSRSFFDNEIWQAARAFSECEAWLDLIQSARFEASPTTSRIGSYEVTWSRGQYPASNRFLAKKWGRSEQWVKTFLGKLKRKNMITTDNGQGVNIITLVNFDKYNGETSYNPPNNPSCNPLNDININELQGLVTHLVTQQLTHLLKKQPTTNPNNKKEEEENNKKKALTNVSGKEKFLSSLPSQNAEYKKFVGWLIDHTPYCFLNMKIPSEAEFGKLKEKYTGKQLAEVMEQLENRKDKRKCYSSIYRTLLNWAKREYGTS